MPNTFHARHSAVAKTYEYRSSAMLFVRRFWRATSTPAPGQWIVDALQRVGPRISEGSTIFELCRHRSRAGQARMELRSEPDYRPFRARAFILSRQGDNGTDIFSSDWEEREHPGGITGLSRPGQRLSAPHGAQPGGNDAGRGPGTDSLPPISGILAARNRAAAGPTAPARGLFLHSVEYGEQGVSPHLSV